MITIDSLEMLGHKLYVVDLIILYIDGPNLFSPKNEGVYMSIANIAIIFAYPPFGVDFPATKARNIFLMAKYSWNYKHLSGGIGLLISRLVLFLSLNKLQLHSFSKCQIVLDLILWSLLTHQILIILLLRITVMFNSLLTVYVGQYIIWIHFGRANLMSV